VHARLVGTHDEQDRVNAADGGWAVHERQGKSALTAEALIARYLEPNPGRPGPADWRLRQAGVSVWAVVGQWLAANRDTDEVASAYSIPRQAVEAALAYYQKHPEIIEARLAANAL